MKDIVKKNQSYRLSERTYNRIADIAKQQCLSQADVITVLVNAYHDNPEGYTEVNMYFDILSG
jgi:predicted DNA-binding protein